MALKTQIKEAFLKNLTPDNPAPDFEISAAGQEKVDTLAEDLTMAIIDFITSQTFRVDKLSAPVLQSTVSGNPLSPVLVVGGTAPGGGPLLPATAVPPTSAVNLASTTGFIIETTADVDKDGRAENGSLDAKDKSDTSMVTLREDQVANHGLPKPYNEM